MIQWNTVIVGLIFQQSIALFVLKSGAGFSLFKWIANAAADFLHQGGLAATFFSGNDPTYTAWFLFGTLGAVIFFIAFVQMVRRTFVQFSVGLLLSRRMHMLYRCSTLAL